MLNNIYCGVFCYWNLELVCIFFPLTNNVIGEIIEYELDPRYQGEPTKSQTQQERRAKDAGEDRYKLSQIG